LIAGIVRDRLTLFYFNRSFSGAGERPFRDYLNLVIFTVGAIRFWSCWFVARMNEYASTSRRSVFAREAPKSPTYFTEARIPKSTVLITLAIAGRREAFKAKFRASDAIETRGWAQFV
jgi:hypothetical protein